MAQAPLTSKKCTGTDDKASGNCVQVGSTISAGASGSGYGQETEITSNGARFDGDGDYLSIPSIDYATDST